MNPLGSAFSESHFNKIKNMLGLKKSFSVRVSSDCDTVANPPRV